MKRGEHRTGSRALWGRLLWFSVPRLVFGLRIRSPRTARSRPVSQLSFPRRKDGDCHLFSPFFSGSFRAASGFLAEPSGFAAAPRDPRAGERAGSIDLARPPVSIPRTETRIPSLISRRRDTLTPVCNQIQLQPLRHGVPHKTSPLQILFNAFSVPQLCF